jgi:uncharacterized RDD family membrane protein YckC
VKCPKCGYVGFEESARCRHCGYDFTFAAALEPPAGPPATPAPVPPRSIAPAVVVEPDAGVVDEFFAGPGNGQAPTLDRLGFVDLQALDAPAAGPLADLPLAEPAAGPPSDLFESPPPARPPLVVRRGTDRPRSRPATQVVRRSPSSLLDADLPAAGDAATGVDESEARSGPATLAARFGAGAIDLGLLGAIAVVVVYFTVRLAGLTMADVGRLPVAPLAAFLLGLAVSYLAAFTACGGQTLGKMAAGVKVVADGGAVPPGAAALRAVMALAGAALGGLGFLPALFDGDHRGLHDRLAGTRVVRL